MSMLVLSDNQMTAYCPFESLREEQAPKRPHSTIFCDDENLPTASECCVLH